MPHYKDCSVFTDEHCKEWKESLKKDPDNPINPLTKRKVTSKLTISSINKCCEQKKEGFEQNTKKSSSPDSDTLDLFGYDEREHVKLKSILDERYAIPKESLLYDIDVLEYVLLQDIDYDILLKKKNRNKKYNRDLAFIFTNDNNVEFDKHHKTKNKDLLKKYEDEWGNMIRRKYKLKLKDDDNLKNWSNTFGETIVGDYLKYVNRSRDLKEQGRVRNPNFSKIKHHDYDYLDSDFVYEVKMGTYFTTGTAHEKLYGIPWKYSDTYSLTNKPLKVVCLCEAERHAKEWGLIENDNHPISQDKIKLRDYFKNELKITFHGFSDMLKELM